MKRIQKLFFLIYLITIFFIPAFAQINDLKVEGKVTFVSKLPDPAKAAYADYYFSAIVEISSSSLKEYEKEKVVIYFSGIEDRELTARGNLKVGDKIEVTLIPYDQVDTDKLDAAMADEVTDFSLETFFEQSGRRGSE
jgi:hypothetical protein